MMIDIGPKFYLAPSSSMVLPIGEGHRLRNFIFKLYCLVCEALVRHMYCFCGIVIIVGGSTNFCQCFAFRSFSQKLQSNFNGSNSFGTIKISSRLG